MLVVAVAAHGPLTAVLPEDQAAAVAVVLVEQMSRVRRERLTLAVVAAGLVAGLLGGQQAAQAALAS